LSRSGIRPEVVVFVEIGDGVEVVVDVVVKLGDCEGLQPSLVLVLDVAIDFRHIPIHVVNVPIHFAKSGLGPERNESILYIKILIKTLGRNLVILTKLEKIFLKETLETNTKFYNFDCQGALGEGLLLGGVRAEVPTRP